jgi:hypothetical protein
MERPQAARTAATKVPTSRRQGSAWLESSARR